MAKEKAKKAMHSTQKRAKQNEVKRVQNRSERTRVKTTVKNLLANIESGKKEELDASLKQTIKSIDKLKSKGIIHRKTASRKISRLTKRVNAAKTV